MIKVTLYKRDDEFIYKFTVSGHSGYATKGNDIICSAVSALSQTAIGALVDLTEMKINYRINEDKAHIRCEIIPSLVPGKISIQEDQTIALTIMRTFEIGCRQISESYGEKYLTVFNSSTGGLGR